MAVAEMTAAEHIHQLASVVESGFREMPALRLTAAQVCRLWNLSPAEAARVLNHLVDAGVLMTDRKGQYYCSRRI